MVVLQYKGHTFLGDGAACSCCLTDKKALNDPTGTRPLRAKMRGTLDLRWRKLRVLVKQIIVDHDLLQLNAGGLMPVKAPAISQGGTKVQAFQRWIDQGLNAIVVGADGSVMRPFVRDAYSAGQKFAVAQIGRQVLSGEYTHTTDTVFQLAVVELQGIAEAVSQQATRAVANGLLFNKKPSAIVRDIFDRIDKIGIVRTQAMVNQIIVAAFNQAALDTYEAAKINRVGIVAEAKPPSRLVGDAGHIGRRIARSILPSRSTIGRIKRAERAIEALGTVNVLTAGDDDVCPICEDIADSGPYDINEARSLIPAHPNCRCAFVPVDDERFAEAEADG
jgi:hypothetical protein